MIAGLRPTDRGNVLKTLPSAPETLIQLNELLSLSDLRGGVLLLKIIKLPLSSTTLRKSVETAVVARVGQIHRALRRKHGIAQVFQAILLGGVSIERRVHLLNGAQYRFAVSHQTRVASKWAMFTSASSARSRAAATRRRVQRTKYAWRCSARLLTLRLRSDRGN